MSGTFDTPRVRLRLSADDDADADELPFVLGIVGDFSGAESRQADAARPRFQSTRPPVSQGWGEETLGIDDLLRRFRPCIRLDGLAFAAGPVEWRPVVADGEAGADALACFAPSALALSPAMPALRATTLLLQGLLRWRAGGMAAPPRDVDLAGLATLCRAAGRVLGDPKANALLAVLPEPPGETQPVARLLALAAWIEVALFQQAALQGLPAERLGERYLAPLHRFDLEGAIRDSFIPAFWRLLEGGAGRRALPWSRDVAPLLIRLLLGACQGELAAVLLGQVVPQAAHAGWLAGALEASAGEMVTAVLRHPAFQAVEANWRALAHLLDIGAGPACELRVLDMTKDGVRSDLDAASSEELSTMHHLMHGEGLGALGATPLTVMLCLFELGPEARDARLAQKLARLGRAAICPVLCSASPGLLAQALGKEVAVEPVPAWPAARQDEAASFLGLCAPRLLARARHRTPPGQAASFRYSEPASADPAALPWVGGAVGLAQRALVAFQRFGWHVAIAGTADDQGVVTPLALEPIGTAGATRPPVSVVLTEQGQEAARRAGLAVMVHLPGRDAVAFLDAPSMLEPPPLREGIGGADPTARRLAARLPYVFAGTRVGHHLLVTLRQELGRAPMTDTDVEALASRWLSQYVAWQADAAVATRAEKPLRRARAEARADPSRPGFIALSVALQPHFQVDGLGVDFTLADAVPMPTPARDIMTGPANGP
jgi:type VI secretion system ImpC/EvpB family protein